MKISHNIMVGKINILATTRIIDHGLILRNHNGDQEVLLPNAYVADDMRELSRAIEVFVYTDSEDRLVATTHRPLALEGEFGYFEVVDLKSYGAFVDWGLQKDLFVPISHQKVYFEIGKRYILRVALDEQTGRLYGSQRIGKWLEKPSNLTPSQKVKILIMAKTPMGYKVIIENKFEGMLYENEIFESLKVGQRRAAYIKKIRNDGKIDCSLQPIGKQAVLADGQKKILSVIEELGGSIEVTKNSSPKEIEKLFCMSKKSFKAVVNELIKSDQLKIINDKLSLQ